MKLTSENIEIILLDCLFKQDEDTSNAVVVEGVMSKFGFHPDRLKAHSDEILDMLKCLPIEFMRNGGGGYTFLNACIDNNGEQWGDHSSIDKLLMLGIAIGKASILLPREMWHVLPGGMPYFVVEN